MVKGRGRLGAGDQRPPLPPALAIWGADDAAGAALDRNFPRRGASPDTGHLRDCLAGGRKY